MNEFAFYMHRRAAHWRWHSGHWLGPIILIAIILLAFEIWMIVDCIKNPKVPTDHKVWWIIGMLFIHPIVAIVYYFVSRLHYNKLKPSKSKS